jgi:hypothetical protein
MHKICSSCAARRDKTSTRATAQLTATSTFSVTSNQRAVMILTQLSRRHSRINLLSLQPLRRLSNVSIYKIPRPIRYAMSMFGGFLFVQLTQTYLWMPVAFTGGFLTYLRLQRLLGLRYKFFGFESWNSNTPNLREGANAHHGTLKKATEDLLVSMNQDAAIKIQTKIAKDMTNQLKIFDPAIKVYHVGPPTQMDFFTTAPTDSDERLNTYRLEWPMQIDKLRNVRAIATRTARTSTIEQVEVMMNGEWLPWKQAKAQIIELLERNK